MVSHELRSPLTAIKGYAATLLRHERRLVQEERHEFLRAIVEASERLQDVIDQLLEISQLEMGVVQIEHMPIDLDRLTRDAVLAARQRTERIGPGRFVIAVRRESLPGGAGRREILALGDARRLRTVLDNLLENAVKYSPSGGEIAVILRSVPTVSAGAPARGTAHAGDAAASPSGATQPMVEIEVRDSGIGIPSDHVPHVFDRFHRVDNGLTREVEGLGLGLAICQRIVEMHGGVIWVESGPGAGSRFHVRLPAPESH
jgi:signal transduction histidine kinase